MKNPTNFKTFFENTIIESIDFDNYNLSNDMYLYDKIKTLYNIFVSEYGFKIKKIGEIKAFEEWLTGLPSVCSVPFYNFEILENAKKSGLILENCSENEEDTFLLNYWANLSKAFFCLKNNL